MMRNWIVLLVGDLSKELVVNALFRHKCVCVYSTIYFLHCLHVQCGVCCGAGCCFVCLDYCNTLLLFLLRLFVQLCP